MGSIKSKEEKEKLIVEGRKTRRLPAFVVARTQRKVRENTGRRHWRKRRIKIRTKLGIHSIKSRRRVNNAKSK